MKTKDEVEELKRNWCVEPIWDLAETDGFGEFREELESFQRMMEEKWEMEYRQRMLRKAAQLGLPGNVLLAGYVESLEERVRRLEKR